jgi:hypothetical protein
MEYQTNITDIKKWLFILRWLDCQNYIFDIKQLLLVT